MKRQLAHHNISNASDGFGLIRLAIVGCLFVGAGTLGIDDSNADDGLSRLLKRAAIGAPQSETPNAQPPETSSSAAVPNQASAIGATINSSSPACSYNACLIPHSIGANDGERQASFSTQQEFTFTDPSGFDQRNLEAAEGIVYPTPLAYGKQVYGTQQQNAGSRMSTPGFQDWNPNAGRDEYVFDGNDRGEKVRVDQSWNVYGLETEDTVGHFDTIDGRRIVTPSNRVAIYAPRFGAVRKVDGVFNARLRLPVGALEEQTPIARADGNDSSTTSKQHLAVNRYDGSKRASGFVDRTRGVVADTVTHLFGVRNNFLSFENLSLIKTGRVSSGESARLNLGLQSALVWEDNLGLQVVAKKVAPIIVRDVKTIQEYVHVESEDGTAILRVTKIASKIAAKTGEIVDFTIRFDNLSGKKIGNVTIIDNLTRRLEYVPNSAESSLKADFIDSRNDGGSLMLRWEIVEPVNANSGGIIRFQCRVR